MRITGRNGLVLVIRDAGPAGVPSEVSPLQTTAAPNLRTVPSANPCDPRPLMGPDSADLPAVPPVPHERHLPVAAPAHDLQIAVGGQGHVPGAGQQSGCGGGDGRQGSWPQREAQLMPGKLRCPRRRRRPGRGANAKARPTETPLP